MSLICLRRARGFTLIELVVVLAILIALAALVVPKLSFISAQAGAAAAATGAGQLVSNLEVYRTTTGSYPLGLDSLVTTGTGDLYAPLWEHAAPVFGPGDYFEVADLVDAGGTKYLQSFGHAFASSSTGATRYVFDHSATSTDYDHSATTSRTLLLDGTDDLCFVKSTPGPFIGSFLKSLGYSSGTIPAGVKLVVFGVGPGNSMIGRTMVSAPRHSEQDTTYYARYLAVFAVYSSGKAAELKGVVDSQGVGIGGNVSSYELESLVHE